MVEGEVPLGPSTQAASGGVAAKAPRGRSHWGSRLGFVLAASGSAVGLGNIWKFPYIAGQNGGGLFVLIYLLAIAGVGIPILMAEVLLGRSAQRSSVGAFRRLGKGSGVWTGLGWLLVACGSFILSYYSVVAGWCLYYAYLALVGGLGGIEASTAPQMFGALVKSGGLNIALHFAFMALTVGIVMGGVRSGVERASRILMPALFLMLLGLLVYATTLPGFAQGFRFIFALDASQLTPQGVLEALGHSFFSLSVGMGALLAYGSYLRPKDSLVGPSLAIGGLDTIISLMACLVIFPVIFSFGMESKAGPGLVFQSLPVAFAKLPGATIIAVAFFLLLAFAALTSAISLLEVGASCLIEEGKLSRKTGTLAAGVLVFLIGVPSALSGGELFGARLEEMSGRSWFDWFDYITSNLMLPLGGLGIALFTAWKVDIRAAKDAFHAGSRAASMSWVFTSWITLLRYVVPVAIVLIFLHSVGLL